MNAIAQLVNQYPKSSMLLIGLIFGIIFERFLFKGMLSRSIAGIMHVDTTDKNLDRMLAEFSIPVDEIPKKKYLILKVQKSDLIDQEGHLKHRK